MRMPRIVWFRNSAIISPRGTASRYSASQITLFFRLV
ncbi:hypothetical protein MGSAQ_001077 [marine sediment metagenome]|uniref:Uncharacterized protein n=1 Tax=marine sediment metagenome TaxID=412755 RepID=A0A1B6NXH0_9ZZZZ